MPGKAILLKKQERDWAGPRGFEAGDDLWPQGLNEGCSLERTELIQ